MNHSLGPEQPRQTRNGSAAGNSRQICGLCRGKPKATIRTDWTQGARASAECPAAARRCCCDSMRISSSLATHSAAPSCFSTGSPALCLWQSSCRGGGTRGHRECNTSSCERQSGRRSIPLPTNDLTLCARQVAKILPGARISCCIATSSPEFLAAAPHEPAAGASRWWHSDWPEAACDRCNPIRRALI